MKAVITTINEPTKAVKTLAKVVGEDNLLVVADKKSPKTYDLKGVKYIDCNQQAKVGLDIVKHLPFNQYSRKNIGYLLAMSSQPRCIYETDDDNEPTSSWLEPSSKPYLTAVDGGRWINVYKWFNTGFIWPRGFPLSEVNKLSSEPISKFEHERECLIQQGMANGNPDVDAVWRLLFGEEVRFYNETGLYLSRGQWCPFNSQNTWWFKKAYPLMYLPSYCSMRATDIWRSFVAQRCLWEIGGVVAFTNPTVFQDRNYHNLLVDFQHEVDVHLFADKITKALEDIPLRGDVYQSLYKCYAVLVSDGFFPSEELVLVEAWINDCKNIIQ